MFCVSGACVGAALLLSSHLMPQLLHCQSSLSQPTVAASLLWRYTPPATYLYEIRLPSLCGLYSGCSVLACASGSGSFTLPCHVSEVSTRGVPLSGLSQAHADKCFCCTLLHTRVQRRSRKHCSNVYKARYHGSPAVLQRLLGCATFVLLLHKQQFLI